MLALAAAREAGVDPRQAVPALAGVSLPKGRGTLLQLGGITVIDDSYNANPASLRAALEFAAWYAARAREIAALHPTLVAAVGDFVPAFEPERNRLGTRLLTAADAEALGPKLAEALQRNAARRLEQHDFIPLQ